MSTFVCTHVWTWSPLAVQSVPNSVPVRCARRVTIDVEHLELLSLERCPLVKLCSPNVPGTQGLEMNTFSPDSFHLHWTYGQRSESIRSELSVSQMHCTNMSVCLLQSCTVCNALRYVAFQFADLWIWACWIIVNYRYDRCHTRTVRHALAGLWRQFALPNTLTETVWIDHGQFLNLDSSQVFGVLRTPVLSAWRSPWRFAFELCVHLWFWIPREHPYRLHFGHVVDTSLGYLSLLVHAFCVWLNIPEGCLQIRDIDLCAVLIQVDVSPMVCAHL